MNEVIYSVSELNLMIKSLLEGDRTFTNIQIQGEISNFKRYSSGHCYFTLKDAGGVLKAVMFRNQARSLRFEPQNGDTVVAIGRVGVYERDGVYQLYTDLLLPLGAGDLMLAYEELKKKLTEEGLFDSERKRELPLNPKTVGMITSPSGAAVRDMITVARRRNRGIKLLLFPVKVQGDGSAAEIVRAIRFMNKHRLADVLIVGRGGGSIEDLWAFNERMVAQAVFDCTVPIISAVGHETDTTIIDYVADLRAPTPSAAAELAVTAANDIDQEILSRQERLYRQMDRVLQRKRQQAEQREMRLKYLSPANRIREKRTYSIQLEERLENRMQTILRDRRHTLALYIERMKAVSPLEKLNSGFSYVEAADGKNIRSVTQVHEGDSLRIRVSDGVIDTKVEQVQQGDRFTV